VADSAWITGPLTTGQPVAPWNAPGQPAPGAPPVVGVASAATAPLQVQAHCGRHVRDPETPEEQQVAAAGWSILGGATAGWDVRVVRGTINLDEQCRPVLYQDFVFVGGGFAGTVSPGSLTPGADGDLWARVLATPNHLAAAFAQYYPETPQCCPAGLAALDLQIQRPGGPAVVAPGRAASLTPPPPLAYAGQDGAVGGDPAGPGAWLNAVPGGWNTIGGSVPPSPQPPSVPDACGGLLRAPQTDVDRQVAAAGWALFGGSTNGWGVAVVPGLAGMDAQCRPQAYQDFVFVDGVFAGTAAPQPMNAQQDGALTCLELVLDDQLVAIFSRYAPGDAPGSPSGRTELDLSIARSAAGPVVTPLGPPPPPGT
jgi:hypothetical protein